MSSAPGNKRLGTTAAICAVVVAGMVGMSFAAVPLYQLFCQVTGFGGTTQRALAAPDTMLERTITVRFDGNVANGLGWSFRPVERQVTVRLGETAEIRYIAENQSSKATTGTASFNVTPEQTGIYFNKIQCFCFTQQTLQPGEKMEMPVIFFVDPSLDEDSELDYLRTITLSYTFFPDRDAKAAPVAAAPSGQDGEKL